jgi:hypothetical protein
MGCRVKPGNDEAMLLPMRSNSYRGSIASLTLAMTAVV